MQRVELFLETNVCYECKCIFFQILYTVVAFMKVLWLACIYYCPHVYTIMHKKNIFVKELNVNVYCAVPLVFS